MITLSIHTPKGVVVSAVPECWNELKPLQLEAVANLLFADHEDAVQRDTRLALAICGLPIDVMTQIDRVEFLEELLPLTAWIQESCDLTEQLIPSVNIEGSSFYGPQSHLRNMLFNEFDAAERALYHWHQDTKDFAALCSFIAILYRPCKKKGYDIRTNPEGDVREAYNDNLNERYAKMLEQYIPKRTAYAILIWYKGCRQYITERFPSVFTVEADTSEVAAEPAYMGLIRMIAKEGIYGTFEQVEKLFIYTAFTELAAASEERANAEEEMRNAKNHAP